MRALAPIKPKDRFEVYRFFNGIATEAQDGLINQTVRLPLVKTFLLEHVGCRNHGSAKTPEQIFTMLGADVSRIDESFMSIKADVLDDETKKTTRQIVGFLESFEKRFFAYYTCESSINAKKRVEKWIQNPDLDHTWFTSQLFQELWHKVVSKRGDNKFTKLVFEHESVFDLPEDSSDTPNEEEITEHSDSFEQYEDNPEKERRRARFEMRDRIKEIKPSLENLQKNYKPLHVICSLRIPSTTRRGGHDLYQTGQVTNRTSDFEEHRNTVLYLYQIYKSILNQTEESAWNTSRPQETIKNFTGAPLIIKFEGEELPEQTFNKWVQLAFQKRNVFKLWGNPIRLGPKKVHVYGADRHLWQPIYLEITTKGVVAILPEGTCGNTFLRLVTNIQRYVCPEISAWIGSERFEDVMSKWTSSAEIKVED